jgi:hypothetical protein
MATVYDNGQTVVEEAYALYKGLDTVFAQTQNFQTTRTIKNNLGLMVLELDLALKSFEDGDKPRALDHHRNMQRYSSMVLRETETLTGVSPAAKEAGAKNINIDVRSLVADLQSTAAIAQPWQETLGAIETAQRAKQDAAVAKISLMQDADIPRPVARKATAADIAFTFAMAVEQTFDTPVAQATTVKDIHWARREYRQLAQVLESLSTQGKYTPARGEAMVALSCLKTLNRHDVAVKKRVQTTGSADDRDSQKAVREYTARLNTYLKKLNRNDAVSDGAKANLRRFGQPAQQAVKSLGKMLAGPGMLFRAFRYAVAAGAQIVGKKPEKSAVSRFQRTGM